MLLLPRARLLLRSKPSFRIRLHQRPVHTTPPCPSPPPTASSASVLGGLTAELDKLAPRFDIHPAQIQIIKTPADFYSTLKAHILRAKHRVFLSTLYIGKSEHELIETLRTALTNEPNLKVSILSDALRGTRESPKASCASLLAPLIEEFGEDRVEIRMYHTPNLTGWRKRFIPLRLNEGWGLQHMKLYGFDEEIILSGANLSSDYFTNRQDRYHVYSSKKMTDYYANIHNAVGQISYQVLPDKESQQGYKLVWPTSNPAPQPTEKPLQFKKCATALLGPLIRPYPAASERKSTGTIVYPLAQFTPLFYPVDQSTELIGLSSVLQYLTYPEFVDSRWTFTAGYFNIHPTLKALLLASKSAKGEVITASPEANGFFGSAGISGNLPPAYTLLSKRFLQEILAAKKQDSITLKEWKNGVVGEPEGWTYHAKGIWVHMPGENGAAITLIGSSNYTRRSYSLDLEMNALVITQDLELKSKLEEEVAALDQFTDKVTLQTFEKPDRAVGWRVKFLLWLFEKQL